MSEEDNLTKESLLYHHEYVSEGWSKRLTKASWPWDYIGRIHLRSKVPSAVDHGSDPDCDVKEPGLVMHDARHAGPIRSSRCRHVRTAGYIVSILFLVVYVFTTAPLLTTAILARRKFHCGKTLEEAKARGCGFDELTVQWLPPQCSRAGLEEFQGAHGRAIDYKKKRAVPGSTATATATDMEPWTKPTEHGPDQDPNEHRWRYFKDENQTEEYVGGLAEAPIGQHMYWTTRGEHLAHCTWILIRGAEARAAGQRLDGISEETEHTRHCALFLYEYARRAAHFDTIQTPGDVMLGTC